MALDLNISPYYDDFNPSKQFEKVLFKPGVAVQARELTQLQSYLTAAIGNHAQFNLTEGARVSGGEATILRKPFIKINDTNALVSGVTIVDAELINYVGDTVTGSVTGIKAKILSTVIGSDSHAVDKKTLYLAYTGGNPTEAGNEASSVHFIADETLTVTSTDSGRNGDTFVVDNTHNSAVNPTAAQIAGWSLRNNYYGYGLFFVIADGVFFMKNQFVTHLRQEIIVDKYTPIASSWVGLKVKESIITSDGDTSLLDPASGTFNYNAPGADRYKISTEIAKLAIDADEEGDDEFIATDKIINGEYYQKIPDDLKQLAKLGKILAQRTSEESGNYVTKAFAITLDEHLATGSNRGKFSAADGGLQTKLALSIGSGTAYVNGYRHSFGTSTVLPVNKGNTTLTQAGQTVSTAYGNYFLVDEFCGKWNIRDGNLVKLFSATTPRVAVSGGAFSSAAAAGATGGDVIIGQARVKHVAYDTGTIGTSTCKYRIYLYDIKITGGALGDIKGIYHSASTDSGFADIVLEGSPTAIAVLKEPTQNKLLFRAPYKSAKTLAAGGGGAFDTQYVHQEEYAMTFATSGISAITATLPMTFPYSASITQTLINDNFTLICSEAATITPTGGSATAYLKGQVIPLTPAMFTVVASTGITLDLGSINTSMNATLLVNVTNTNTTPVDKVLKSDVYVKIKTTDLLSDPAGNAGGAYGPWNLGIPDIFKIQSVFVSADGYTTTGQDQRNKFTLDSGQADNMYGHGRLIANPGQLNTTNKYIVVKLQCFTPDYSSGTGTWFSVDSYPVDDNGAVGKIFTYEIPEYRSKVTGKYSLRDCIDFRPYVQATANVVENNYSTTATSNPATGQTFASPPSGLQIPNPNTNFTTDVQYYIPRIDKIVITDTGEFVVVEGIPSVSPRSPAVDFGMPIAELSIPPYPSISPFLGKVFQKPGLTVGKRLLQTRRYTMSDISAIEKRINRLEYYTALSLMEREAESMKILDANGLDRFKNGIFVNVFDSHALSAVSDPGFKAAINPVTNSVGPGYTEDNANLAYNSNSSTNIRKTGNLLTLPYTTVKFGSNDFSSKARNCVGELLFDYVGDLAVYPRSQNHVDTEELDDLALIDESLDLFAGELADNISKAQIVASYEMKFAGVANDPSSASFMAEGSATTEFAAESTLGANAEGAPMNDAFGANFGGGGVVDIGGSVGVEGSVGVTGAMSGDVITQSQTITQSATSSMLTAQAGSNTPTTMDLGSRLIAVDVNTFMRSDVLCVLGTRLKPGTKLHAFFDGVSQSANVRPVGYAAAKAIIADDTLDILAKKAAFVAAATDVTGTHPVTDVDGNFAALYYLPGGQFITGERLLRFSDDVKDRPSFVTTSSNTAFSAFGLSTTAQKTIISTQLPSISFGETSPVTTVVGDFTTVTSVEIANVNLSLGVTSEASVTTDITANSTVTQMPQIRGPADPIAQTFSVSSPDGLFITDVKVFFRSKSATEGITCQLREVVNGYPAKTILPYGESYLSPASVNITTEDAEGIVDFGKDPDDSSVDPTKETTFTFDAPVYLKGGTEYCFVLLPQGNSPEYNIWVSELGANKINTTNRVFQEDTNIGGILFTSANNRTWNAHQAEDITYRLMRAEFDTSVTGSAHLNNSNVDFLKLGNIGSGKPAVGSVVHGFDNVAVVTGGSGHAVDDIITLATKTDSGSAALTGVKVKVVTVTSGGITSYIVTDPGDLSPAWVSGEDPSAAAQTSTTGSGTGASFNLPLNRGICVEMNALKETGVFRVTSGHFRDGTSGAIVSPLLADRSSASGNPRTIFDVTAVLDKKFNQVRTTIGNIDFSKTSLAHSFAPTDASSGIAGAAYETIAVDSRKNVATEMAIRSYSNENYTTSGAKTFNHKVVFKTTDTKLSPVIDTTRMSMLIKSNVINNDSTNEAGNQGGAIARFINKPVILAQGMEAEDILVQVALKQPSGSAVEVWGKFMSAEDDADFIRDISWIKLVRHDDFSPKSAAMSETAYVDFGFKINPTDTNAEGQYTYTTDRVTDLTIATAGSGYTSAPILTFSTGAASGHALLNGSGAITSLILTNPGRDYSDAPTVVVGTQWTSTATYATGQQVFNGANMYTADSSYVTNSTAPIHTSGTQAHLAYTGPAAKVTAVKGTVTFTNYKQFSTKLVFLSSNTSKTPEAKELRCIALQA